MRKSDKMEMIIKLCSVSIILCACGRDSLVQEADEESWMSVQTASDVCERNSSSVQKTNEADLTSAEWNFVNQEDSGLAEWKQAYINYLDNFANADVFVYSLIYVDDDEISELVIENDYSKEGILIDGGCQALLTFQDHELDVWKPVRSRFTYIERGNRICHTFNSRENASSNFDNVYTIENGKWVYIGGGYWEWKQRGFAFIKYEVCEYYWDENGVDIQVSKEEYSRRLNAIYPEGAGKYPQNHYGLEEIYSILRNCP